MEHIRIEKQENIAIIVLAYEENNVLNEKFMAEIGEALDRVAADRQIQALVVTGADRVFCAGADVEEMLPLTAAEALRWGALGADLNTRIEKFHIPVVAAINGMALGGGNELAMACHYRIASRRARFAQPECTLGITPGAGATVRLPRLVGTSMAKQLLFTGQMINASKALQIGLVDRITQPERLLEEAIQWARELAAPSACEYKED